MERSCIAILLVLCGNWLFAPPVSAKVRIIQPSSTDFELTLRENPDSGLPLAPTCTGESEPTLRCRAFVLSLKNVSSHIVRIAGCKQSSVAIETRVRSDWQSVSGDLQPMCTGADSVPLRLKPSESTEYETRINSLADRSPYLPFANVLTPGAYTMRAKWRLVACAEYQDGSDCFPTSAKVVDNDIWLMDSAILDVTSDEIEAESPPIKGLGEMKFGFQVTPLSGRSTPNATKAKCTGDAATSIECETFRFSIRNLGSRAVIIQRSNCRGPEINVEYRKKGIGWTPLKYAAENLCTTSDPSFTSILPGEAVIIDAALGELFGSLDLSPLHPAGEYYLRFGFWPHACFASPDAGHCVQIPKRPRTSVMSNDVVTSVTDYVPLDNHASK